MSFLWLPFALLLIAWAIAGYKGISIPEPVKWQSRWAGILLSLVLSTRRLFVEMDLVKIITAVLIAAALILTVLAFSSFASSGGGYPTPPNERRRDRDRDPNRQRRNKNRRRFSEGEDPGEPPTSRPL